ncbi:MAG: hypothetical protein JNK37_12265 [Verrucomicrobiales bacterium]|nr:hypothetical protein [Verrucomicrobiales bacterium]
MGQAGSWMGCVVFAVPAAFVLFLIAAGVLIEYAPVAGAAVSAAVVEFGGGLIIEIDPKPAPPVARSWPRGRRRRWRRRRRRRAGRGRFWRG